jgi:hypothetical protein
MKEYKYIEGKAIPMRRKELDGEPTVGRRSHRYKWYLSEILGASAVNKAHNSNF